MLEERRIRREEAFDSGPSGPGGLFGDCGPGGIVTVSHGLHTEQLPVGNMSLPGGANQWKDNRVDYFFAHTDELMAIGSAAMAFGAGQGDQTNPSTDGGNLVSKVKAYEHSGGQKVCP